MDKEKLSKLDKLKQLAKKAEYQVTPTFNLEDYDLDKVDASDENSKKWGVHIVKSQYNKTNGIEFKLGSFKYSDIDLLNKINPEVFRVKDFKSGVWLMVTHGKEEEFKNCLPEIKEVLESTNNYKNLSINKLIIKLGLGVEDTITEKDITESNEIIARNWQELLLMLKDPEIRKKFLLFQTTVTCEKYFKGTKLSPQNVIKILSQDPQATFVTDASTWFMDFKRKIKPNARRIVYNKGNNDVSVDDLDKHNISQEVGGYNNLMKISNNTRRGAAWGAYKDTAKSQNNKPNIHLSVGYDVRDTYPIDPNNDIFLTIPDVINNLTGELNDAAIAFVKAQYELNGEEYKEPRKIEGIEDDEQLINFKDKLLKKCAKKEINITDTGNVRDVIAECFYQYGLNVAKSYNILRADNQNLFASVVCATACMTFNIVCQKAKTCTQVAGSLTQEQAEKYAAYAMETYRELCGVKLYESANKLLTLQDFQKIFQRFVKTNNDLKEEFINKFTCLTERINNVPK